MSRSSQRQLEKKLIEGSHAADRSVWEGGLRYQDHEKQDSQKSRSSRRDEMRAPKTVVDEQRQKVKSR
jgi:hypothetical protein